MSDMRVSAQSLRPLSFAALGVPHDSCFYCLPPWTRAQMWERWGRNWRHRGAGKDENFFLVSAHLPWVVLPGTLLKRGRGTSVFLLCSELSWDGKAGVSEETSPPGALCSAWTLHSTRTPRLSPPHSLLLQIPSKTPRLSWPWPLHLLGSPHPPLFEPLSFPPPCVPRKQSGNPKISFPCLDSTASRRSSLLTPFPHPRHKPLIWATASALPYPCLCHTDHPLWLLFSHCIVSSSL